MAQVERTMFREYDIRGRVNDDELNAATGELIGRAYGTFLHKRQVDTAVVGYDCRVGSEDIKEGVLEGIRSTGRRIIDLGMCTTPMMYWSQYHFNVMGGAMITGSHNPKGWNGLKLACGLSYTLIGKELEELLATIEEEDFLEGKGEREKVDILGKYARDLAGRVHIRKPFRVVIDAGNGVAGMVAPAVLREAGCEVIEQFCDLDPEFPNHDPDPALKATVEILGKKVVEEQADAGFAFDGDGDRLGVVDDRGQVIWPDRYMILLSRQILDKSPGAKIIFDVKCSQALEEDIAAHGGQPIMWKTGHSHIKAKLHEVKGLLAGEMSGHIFYVDNFYGFDDGIYAGLRFAEYVSSQGDSLSKIIEKAPYYISTPTIHVDCPDTEKYRIVDELTAVLKKKFPRVIDINGARVMFDDGWGLVRASSNMPQLVLRFEAKSEERLEEIKNLFRKYMDEHDEIGKEWENE